MNTVGIIALLAFVACAHAGVIGPAFVHHPVPIVKTIHPVYVPPPVFAKPIIYHHPAPVVKVIHPVPVVKHVHHFGAYGPYGPYGPYGHPHFF